MSGFFSSGRNYGSKHSPPRSYSSYHMTPAPYANVGAYPPVEANHQKVYSHQQFSSVTTAAEVKPPQHEYSHQNSYEYSSATNGHGHGHGHSQGHGQMVEHKPQHAVSHQSSYGYSEHKPAHNMVSHQSSYGYSSSTNGKPYPPKGMGGGGGSPFSALLPSTFPKGTDPQVMSSFQMADEDRSGFIDDRELQKALSGCNKNFSLRTVHLLMFLFTNNTSRKIGPKEFAALFYELKNWREMFEKFDTDRSGKIDGCELQHALATLNFSVSPMVLDLLLSKYDKSGRQKGLQYDNFIECCLVVKGLTEKFRDKDRMCTGSATFSYETFMLTVLPFVIA